jgi:hypothetical protein
MVLPIGNAASFIQVAKRSHLWGERMNWQLIRLAVLTHGAAKSKTDSVPATGAPGDVYIHPINKNIYVWVEEFDDGDDIIPEQWYVITRALGVTMYVADEDKWYFLNQMDEWQLKFDPSKEHRAIQREFKWYNPYLIRPNSVLFSYVATQEWVIEAGAPGSGASCEIAPSSPVTFTIFARGPQVGTITFAAGSLDGVVNIASEVVVLPTVEENQYEKAHVFQVRSPANLYGMEGLSVTICGEIRSID